MPNLNKVFIMGHITRDLELKYTAKGTAVTNCSIAVNRHWKDANGEKQEEVSYIRVAIWAKLAENCSNYLSKGSPVMVEGRLSNNNWETKEGEKRQTMEVVAIKVHFLSAGNQENKKENKEHESNPEIIGPDQDSVPF